MEAPCFYCAKSGATFYDYAMHKAKYPPWANPPPDKKQQRVPTDAIIIGKVY